MTTTKTRSLAKARIKDTLLEYIYSPGDKKYAIAIEQVIEHNNKLKHIYGGSFFYKGKSFPLARQIPHSPHTLHPDLWATVDDLIKQRDDLTAYEKPLVTGLITHVLNSSDCWADYIKVLPDPLHPFIQERRFSFDSQVPTLDDTQVQLILTQHAKGHQFLRNRLLWNLLL